MKRIFERLLAATLLAGVAACTMAGGPAVERDGPEPVRLSDASTSRSQEATAARIYLVALDSLEAGAVEEAAAIASQVVRDYPGSAVSTDALWVRARAFERMEDRTLQALDDAERLLAVLPSDDGRRTPVTLLRARRLVELGEVPTALRSVVALPLVSEPTPDFEGWLRDALRQLGPDDASEIAARTDAGSPIAPIVWLETGRILADAGRDAEAAELGGRAVRAGVEGEALEAARALSQGRPLPGQVLDRVTLAAILPQSGSPAMQQIAAQIEDGIRAAIEASGRGDAIDLRVLDDGGDPMAASALVQAGERQGAIAVIGPLGSEALRAAAEARRGGLVLLSPTAFETPAGVRGVLSLSSYDPNAPETLAEWAVAGPVGPTAVIHPSYGPSAEEARRFAEVYTAAGGRITRMVSFEPGLTYFEEQIRSALASRPSALLLPIPPEDVVALAPQVTFFGLDTLGIRILGTGAWTDDAVLAEISDRHLNGVVTASPDRPLEGSRGRERFRNAYESRFQRTLIDEAIPALGYDAAALVLAAVEAGAGGPDALLPTLERMPAFEGATGDLQVRDGLLRREHTIVCLDRGSLLPTAPGELPVLQYRPYPPDPETDSVPAGPGRRAGYLCPQVAPPDTVIR